MREVEARMHRPVRMRRLGDRVRFLDIVGKDDRGNAALGAGNADGTVDQVARLRGRRAELDVLTGDILEQAGEIDLLLEMAAERRPRCLTHDGDDRLVVELRIVQAVQEMNRSRS